MRFEHPRRVVAIGGGTGMPAVLRGFRRHVLGGAAEALTAIVTMTDDGGSSGRLRMTRGLPPPGDVRNCLVALAQEESLLAGLFQHRYNGREGLGGHSLGNLILAALAEQTGSFLRAVEVSSQVLRTVGRILPSTLEDVTIEATMDDASRIRGETRIAASEKKIKQIAIVPDSAEPSPGIVPALREADLVVLGPGSLFTSVIPNLTVRGIAAALRETPAVRVLVANLVSERGEASGMSLADHVRMIETHAGGTVVDAVLVNEASIPAPILERYRAEGATPLVWPGASNGKVVVRRHLLATGPKLRHEPVATVDGLIEAWRTCRAQSGPRAVAGTAAGDPRRLSNEPPGDGAERT